MLFEAENKMEKVYDNFCDEMRIVVDYRIAQCKKMQKELTNYFTTKIQKGN
jgi:hypothetical protein